MRIALTRTVGIQIAGVFGLTAFLYWAAWVWPTLPFGFGSAFFGGIVFLLPLASVAAVIGMVLAVVDVIQKGNRAQAAALSLGFLVAVIAGSAAGMVLGPVPRCNESGMSLCPQCRSYARWGYVHE